MYLKLLGTVRVNWEEGSPPHFRSQRTVALLGYLVAVGRSFSRDYLATLFWADEELAAGKANLRRELYNLAQILPGCWQTSRVEVEFVPGQDTAVDIYQFLEYEKAGEWDAAAELIGGLFLEGVVLADELELEMWLLTEQERWRQRAEKVLNRLITEYSQQAQYGAALRYARQLLQLTPWNEEIHRQIMLMLAWTGQRTAALKQFGDCSQMLAIHLDIEPSVETIALHERILSGDLSYTTESTPIILPPFLAEQPQSTSSTSSFVARDNELGELDHFLQLTLVGQGQIVFVTGEAGIGKTTLLQEFVRRAQKQNPNLIVARGRCNVFGGVGDPYLPFREILDLLSGDIESRWVAGSLDRTQVVLVLDDLQWVDPGSIPDRTQQEIKLYAALGYLHQVTKGLGAPEAEEAYGRAWRLFQEGDIEDPSQSFRVQWGLWFYYCVVSDYRTAFELAERLWRLGERSQDPTLVLPGHRAVGTTNFWAGRFVQAQPHWEEVFTQYKPEDHALAFLYGGSNIKLHCLALGAQTQCWLGYPDQGLRMVQEGLAFAQGLSHPYTLTAAHFFTAWLRTPRRKRKEAQPLSEKAVYLANEYGFPFWSGVAGILRVWALAESGKVEQRIPEMQEALATYQATGASIFRGQALGLLAEMCSEAGQIEQGLAVVDEALAMTFETGERYWEAELHRIKGELLSKQTGAEADAEACYFQAISVAEQQQAKFFELRTVVSLCHLWCRQNRQVEARERLTEIYDWFSEGFTAAQRAASPELIRGADRRLIISQPVLDAFPDTSEESCHPWNGRSELADVRIDPHFGIRLPRSRRGKSNEAFRARHSGHDHVGSRRKRCIHFARSKGENSLPNTRRHATYHGRITGVFCESGQGVPGKLAPIAFCASFQGK